jgi:hypothetical protein
MTAVLRPRPDAVDEFPREGLDLVRFEAGGDAVVAYDGLGRARRFARDGSDTAPVAIGLVTDGGRGPPLYQHDYLALLDGSDRALAWHAPYDVWNAHDVARFAAAAGLHYTVVSGPLRHAPGGRPITASPGSRALRVALVGAPLVLLVLGVLGVASGWLLAVAACAVVTATGVGIRYLPAPRRSTGRGAGQDGVTPPGDGPATG